MTEATTTPLNKIAILSGSVQLFNIVSFLDIIKEETGFELNNEFYFVKEVKQVTGVGAPSTDYSFSIPTGGNVIVQISKISNKDFVIDLSSIPDFEGTLTVNLSIGIINLSDSTLSIPFTVGKDILKA